MRSFFRYPGGKSKISQIITTKLGSLYDPHLHLEYREPFFGGGSIGLSFIKDFQPINIWLNDLDYSLFCLWQSVVNQYSDLQKLIIAYQPHINDFYQFKEDLKNLNGSILELGFKKLVIHQISYSGLGTKSGGPLGGKEQKSKYKIDCRWSPEYLCRRIEELHYLLHKSHIVLTSLDFSQLFIGGEQSLFYLDPPYFKKGEELYEFANEELHGRLCNVLKETKADWVLSYDDCKEIRELYAWANIEEIVVGYSITATKDKDTGKNYSRIKKELLITKDYNA